jgi:hypothetical protein
MDQFGKQAMIATGLAAVLLIPAAWAAQRFFGYLQSRGGREKLTLGHENREAALVE